MFESAVYAVPIVVVIALGVVSLFAYLTDAPPRCPQCGSRKGLSHGRGAGMELRSCKACGRVWELKEK